jgi:hypothetical protein
MLIQTWSEVFQVSLQGLWYGFVATFPKILLAVIIFILGWIVATTLGKIIASAIDALKLDKLFKSAGAEEVLARGGIRLHIGKFFGELVKWFIVIVFLVASLNILNLDQVTQFLQQVLAYIPQVIIAALILVSFDKLGIFGYFGQIIFTGLVVMLALGFGLAFGLGGKEAAGRWINRIAEDLNSK